MGCFRNEARWRVSRAAVTIGCRQIGSVACKSALTPVSVVRSRRRSRKAGRLTLLHFSPRRPRLAANSCSLTWQRDACAGHANAYRFGPFPSSPFINLCAHAGCARGAFSSAFYELCGPRGTPEAVNWPLGLVVHLRPSSKWELFAYAGWGSGVSEQ